MRYDLTTHRQIAPALAAIICMHCHYGMEPGIPYVPQVTFTGYINGDYDSLVGNRSWPNRCELAGDTVRIFCHSTFFSEADRVRHGDMLRIDLLPDSGRGFGKRNTLFHLARYYERNESYTINRGDTIDNAIRFESETREFSRTVGAALELAEIYVVTPPVSGSSGRYLTIEGGHLFGSIHLP